MESPASAGLFDKYEMKWTRLTRTIAASDDVVTLAQAKAQLRIYHDDDDALIARLISAAVASIEGPSGIGIAMMAQTWVMSLDGFPAGPIHLPLHPVSSVTSITYRDEALEEQTLDAASYSFDAMNRDATVWSLNGWPVASCKVPGTVRVTVVAGFDPVPDDLIHAVLMLVAHWYENREAATGQTLNEVPLGVQSILNRYRAAL